MPKETKTTLQTDLSGPSVESVGIRLSEYFPDLTAAQISALQLFYTEFQATNRQITLTSPGALAFVESSLFFDSISASRLIHPKLISGHPVLDFGGGCGFPGVVFGILYPLVPVEIFETDARKIEFLKRVIVSGAFKNISVQMSDFDHVPALSVQNGILRGLPQLSKTLMTGRRQTQKVASSFT